MSSQWLHAVPVSEILEVELAKQKFLAKLSAARKLSMDNINEDGRFVIQHLADAENLSNLNIMWRQLQQKARERQIVLEVLLRGADSFHSEICHLLKWLSKVYYIIVSLKPVGGLPETAFEQLQIFMDLQHEIEDNRPMVEAVLQQGQDYIMKQDKPNPASEFHKIMRNLKSVWDVVTARATEKKIELESAFILVTEFHDALQAFNDWLTKAEIALTLLTKIEDHKLFQKAVSTHWKTMQSLYTMGTDLKYFIQEQDAVLITQSLVSVRDRWETVVSKADKNTAALEHGLKKAKKIQRYVCHRSL